MKRITLLSAITLLLGLQSSPILSYAQVVFETVNYHPFYLDAVKYDSTTGVIAVNPDYDATDKVVIKNDSISLSTLSYHYIHFWDDAGTYLGHYATSGAESCSNACIGTISTSDIPLPLGAYSYAVERFDYTGANYEVQTGMTLTELFEDSTNYYEDNTIAIDELAGKTLNEMYPPTLLNTLQLVPNADFSNGTTGWSSENSTSSANGILTNIGSGGGSNPQIYTNIGNKVIGQKYYAVSKMRVTNTVNLAMVVFSTDFFFVVNSPIQNQWYITSGIITASTTYNLLFIRHSYADASTANGKIMEVDYVYAFNISTLITNKTYSPQFNSTFDLMSDANIKTQMDTWVASGLDNVSLYYYATALSFVPNLTVADFIEYYNFYQWNRTSTFGFTPGVFSYITEDWYANDTEEWVYNLTEIFGGGSGPDTSTMATYYSDYLALDDYSYISPLAWAVAPTYTVTYWDDMVGDSITNSVAIIISALIGFVTMILGLTKQVPLMHLVALASFIFFTIQFTAIPMIILGIILVVINALFLYGGIKQ